MARRDVTYYQHWFIIAALLFFVQALVYTVAYGRGWQLWAVLGVDAIISFTLVLAYVITVTLGGGERE